MKKILFLLIASLGTLSFAQSLSDYQYILVPNTFSFQKEAHQYDLNRLAQFLLNKYNFKAFIEGDEYDKLEHINACDLLRLKATSKGLLTTKVTFTFVDCKGKTIYTSKQGTSRLKEYKKSYIEAVRNVFNDRILKTHTYSKKRSVTLPSPKVKETPIVAFKKEGRKEKQKDIQPIAAIEVFQLDFELRGNQYSFIPISKNSYSVLKNSKKIGTIIQLQSSNNYKVNAGTLSGTGSFDDFGNFILKRINPANKKELTDILNRVR